MKEKSKLKNFFKKFWFLLFEDDSLKGWIISIILLFVFIKFIFFPGLSLITGTSLPLAIVESCSMYHGESFEFNFDIWWESNKAKYDLFNINYDEFSKFNFKNGFNKGDILFIIKAKPETLEIGDVIIFNGNQKNPIIHRVVNIQKENENYIFSTLGDNNKAQLSFETSIGENQLIGKAILKVSPYLGWGKLVFFEKGRPSYEKGFCKLN